MKKSKNDTNSTKSNFLSLDEVEEKAVKWLWKRRIPLGAVTVIAGAPKSGKSFFLTGVSAAVTCGARMQVRKSKVLKGSVLFLNGEDDSASALKPRLVAAEANFKKVFIPKIESDSKSDVVRIIKSAKRDKKDLRLVVIDPATSFFKASRYSADGIRKVMENLNRLAAKKRIAILVVVHMNKSEGRGADMRVAGTYEWLATARASYFIGGAGGKGWRYLIPGPSNIHIDRSAIRFKLRRQGKSARVVLSRRNFKKTEEELFGRSRKVSDTTVSAMDFVKAEITQPILSTQLYKQGGKEHFSIKELRTALVKIGIKPKRVGGVGKLGRWFLFPKSWSEKRIEKFKKRHAKKTAEA